MQEELPVFITGNFGVNRSTTHTLGILQIVEKNDYIRG